MADTGKFIIYAMSDPRTDEVRYVGMSSSGMARPMRHLQPLGLSRDDTYKGRWLRGLVASGSSPGIHVLSVMDSRAGLPGEERRWIQYGRAMCWPLTNCTEGGDGLVNPTPEVRAKMSASHTGKPSSRKGYKHTPETLARMAAARVGRKLTPEHRAAIAASGIGRRHSAEAIAKMSAAKMGHEVTAEARAKIGNGHRGRKLTDEHRASLRAAWARRKAVTRG